MKAKVVDDKIAEAMKQGQAQFDSIKEMVEALQSAEEGDNDAEREEARQTIEEDALSVQVRSGWYNVGAADADKEPVEYEILLCTGGPACRIIGKLGEHNEPETAEIEVQDWFTPWTAMRPQVGPDDFDSEPILLAYARVFYFGD